MSKPELLGAERTAKCPKCRKEAWVAFDQNTGEKFINCRHCGNLRSAAGLYFNPSPEFLYKYRPHDGFSESWIIKEELFLASPGSFNDPFDSKIMYTFEGTEAQKKRYWSEVIQLERPQIKKREKWKIINKVIKHKISETEYENHIKRIQKRIDEYGVASFSEKPDDLLMFSYYAKDHTGYCLKYWRANENILSLVRDVKYAPSYPKFSVYDFPPSIVGPFGDKVLLTKAECWKHEAEWRLSITLPTTRVIKPPQPILEGIILGCNMRPEQRGEVIALNNRREKPVKIFQAQKKKFEFALEINPLI